jgi:two-component system response regulator ResD
MVDISDSIGPKKALVIDDDSGVRYYTKKFVERNGYVVDEADSREGAFVQYETGRPYNLVVADFILKEDANRVPIETGVQVALGLIQMGYKGPILFVTGTEQPLIDSLKIVGDIIKQYCPYDMTRKPISLERFNEKLEKLVSGI